MVRYPAKLEPGQEGGANPLRWPKAERDSAGTAKVKYLADRVKFLEDKIKDLETQKISPAKISVASRRSGLQLIKPQHVWKWLMVVFAVLLVGWAGWLWQLYHPTYKASLTYRITPFRWTMVPGLVPQKSGTELPITKHEWATETIRQGNRWPRFLSQQQWIGTAVGWLYQDMLSAQRQGPNLSITARGHSPQEAKDLLISAATVYRLAYLKQRRIELHEAMHLVDKELAGSKIALSSLHQRLEKFSPHDRILPVNASTAASFDRLRLTTMPDLHSHYNALLIQLDGQPAVHWTDALFAGMWARLVDLELKKFLVPPSKSDAFEGGILKVKNQIVEFIYDQGASRPPANGPVNAAIQRVFIRAQLEALDILLNGRFGTLKSLAGPKAEYADLKIESEKLYGLTERLLVSRRHLQKLLSTNQLSGEISAHDKIHVDRMP